MSSQLNKSKLHNPTERFVAKEETTSKQNLPSNYFANELRKKKKTNTPVLTFNRTPKMYTLQ